jgi:hypothetical protein
LRAAVNLLQLVIIIIAAAAAVERIDLFLKVNLRAHGVSTSQREREIREKQPVSRHNTQWLLSF